MSATTRPPATRCTWLSVSGANALRVLGEDQRERRDGRGSRDEHLDPAVEESDERVVRLAQKDVRSAGTRQRCGHRDDRQRAGERNRGAGEPDDRDAADGADLRGYGARHAENSAADRETDEERGEAHDAELPREPFRWGGAWVSADVNGAGLIARQALYGALT